MCSRCVSNHYDPADLILLRQRPSVSSALFVIMSMAGKHNQSDKLKQQLLDGGVDATQIDVVDGFVYGEKAQDGEQISADGICHFSFAYKWLPRAARLLSKQNRSCVFYLEYNAVLEGSLAECFSFLRDVESPLAWLGYRYRWKYDQTVGSKCIVFMHDGLSLVHAAVLKDGRKGFFHLDGVVSRRLPEGSISRPSHSFFGMRQHSSVSGGGGAVFKRPAQRVSANVYKRPAKCVRL